MLGAAASRSPCVCLDWCKKNENHKNRGDVTAPSERGYSDIGGDMPVAQGNPMCVLTCIISIKFEDIPTTVTSLMNSISNSFCEVKCNVYCHNSHDIRELPK